ncbi:hypothetical protein ACP275_06G099400 [Erythranthe tilingii]
MTFGDGRIGFEYRHRFRIDNGILSNPHEHTLLPGVKNIIFDIRTNFIVKKNAVDSVDEGEVLDSEKLTTVVLNAEKAKPYDLIFHTWYRLDDYWMTKDEMDRMTHEAVEFGRQMAAEVADPQPSDLVAIPISVEIDVCTVQQEGEAIDDARERAIRATNLVPLYLWQITFTKNNSKRLWLMVYLRRKLERVRVLNIDEGLGLMNVCSICSKKPVFGAQISTLPCGHAFHTHCIVGVLEQDNLCPTCSYPAYDPDNMLHSLV